MKSELLGTLFLSEKRKDLLLLLIEGPRDIDEIKDILDVTSSAIMTQIKILMSQGLIVHESGLYRLSDMCKVIVKKMQPLLDTLSVYADNKDYWENHNLNAIPSYLLDRIEELSNCEVVEPDLNRMYELPKKLEDSLKQSSYVKEVSSYFSPAYPGVYIDLAKKGIEVSVIVTEPVFDRLQNEYKEGTKEFVNLEHGNLFVCEEKVELASSTVTDKFMSISLFYKTGIYHNHAVMSFEESALNWGEDLFMHYLNISKQITDSDI
ncbi:ArsR family transcriptional regulator [Methanococcoides methylutens]|uniref:ArsR family transcriptional regulator n=1 Tax=Methanococcoides methylutens TaxID=2226 RepID=A0A099T073_METMT|nr:winged helix-turn-helix domain-containing protein [Methanococcoides methylutens]KGK98344.1 ArsR family transcriptional regulator [Methanococcoides methylutens]